MNVNKKLDRFRQWGKEKMGGAADKTDTSDDFKGLEQEMNLRQDGMEKLHSSMNTYVKTLSRREHGEGKDKQTPVGNLGMTMVKHGEEFDDGSKFGECLLGLGQANQRISRIQDSYATNATTSWLEACERSVAQMKDYQKARAKLESRRLAYDTSIAKMNKAKRDDYRVEEEVRSQKAKYDESTEDVYRRMQDIVEAESDNVMELYAFLEAEITYHDRCREVLLQLKSDWPHANDPAENVPAARRPGSQPRSRQNTLSRVPTTNTINEDSDLEGPPPILGIKSRTSSGTTSPFQQPSTPRLERPVIGRVQNSANDASGRPTISRIATDSAVSRGGLLTPSRARSAVDDEGYFADDPIDGGVSPAASQGPASAISRNTSWSSLSQQAAGEARVGKKAPPPPPPNRGTKPKPAPPPPMKRSALSGEL
ncbi:MAG: hypothetical protein Q9162_000509 [Coniocarpon cinnabarinum]